MLWDGKHILNLGILKKNFAADVGDILFNVCESRSGNVQREFEDI